MQNIQRHGVFQTSRSVVLKFDCTSESTKGDFSKYIFLGSTQNTLTQWVCDGAKESTLLIGSLGDPDTISLKIWHLVNTNLGSYHSIRKSSTFYSVDFHVSIKNIPLASTGMP